MENKEKEQQKICTMVREIKGKGFSPWQISKLLGDLVSPRTIERWVAGDCPPKNTKAVIAPLEKLLLIVRKDKNNAKQGKIT